jgi:ABC-type transport system substrate-binding protein
METTDWAKFMRVQISRRRALVTTSTASLAAAFVAACGGSGEDKKQTASGLVGQPVDTTKMAKRGGVFKDSWNADPATFDPHITNISNRIADVNAYQTLVRVKSPPGEKADLGSVYGDALDSWELSPDKLTITLKLRENKWDARAPTNGRVMDSADVVYSFQRYEKVGAFRNEIFNLVNTTAPVISAAAVDPRTVTLKLSSPYPDLLPLFATSNSGAFFMVPKEAEGGFDLRRDQRGSGPRVLSEYVPGVRMIYQRNKDYWEKDRLFFDTHEMPIITEYAQAMAQMRAGSIYTYLMRAEDIVGLKRDISELQLVQDLNYAAPHPYFTIFGTQDVPKNVYRDIRMRQAWSMAIDRDLFIETIFNTAKLESQGIPTGASWGTAALSPSLPYSMDPRGKDFGTNGKYYKHDVAEAKKLMAAAGNSTGVEATGHIVGTGQFGPDYIRQVEVLVGMPAEAGMKTTLTPHDFATEFIPKYRDSGGKFEGITFTSMFVPTGSGRLHLWARYNTAGGNFRGFSKSGRSTFDGDATVQDLSAKILAEFDPKRAESMAQELQKYDSETQYMPMLVGSARPLSIAWPALANFGVYDLAIDNTLRHWWVDDTKAPLKRTQ